MSLNTKMNLDLKTQGISWAGSPFHAGELQLWGLEPGAATLAAMLHVK